MYKQVRYRCKWTEKGCTAISRMKLFSGVFLCLLMNLVTVSLTNHYLLCPHAAHILTLLFPVKPFKNKSDCAEPLKRTELKIQKNIENEIIHH